MKTYKVTAKKGNRPIVKTYTVLYKEGIEETLFAIAKRLGFYDIAIMEG